jgi:hypothetical protein
MIVNEYPESAQLAGPILHFAFRGTDGRHGPWACGVYRWACSMPPAVR